MDLSHNVIQDSGWSSLIYLFNNHSKLQAYLTEEFIDLEVGFVDQEKLLKKSKPWSRSEKFMLRLALHLYSGYSKIDLSEMDYLDDENRKLVITAIKLRFKL